MRPSWYLDLDDNGRRAFRSTYLGFSVDAMSVQVYSFIVPVLLTVWHLSPSSAGLLATATLISSAMGGWSAGVLSDRVGRVRVLRFTVVLLIVSTALCAAARSFDELLLARALQGIGFGAEWAVGAVYMGEVASASTRGRLVGTAQSAWAVGWGLAAATSTVLLATLPPDLAWRFTFMAALPGALVVLIARSRLVETSTFLRQRSRGRWHAIFSGALLGRTAIGCLLAIGTHGGYWALATWWPTMLRVERGMSAAEAGEHMGVLVAGSFVGYLLGAWMADALGRRPTLRLFAVGAIGLTLIATRAPLSNDALLLCAAPLGLCVMGMYSAIGPTLIELFPTPLRGSGLGFCYNMGRGIAGAAPLAVGSTITSAGVAHSIGIYVCVAYGLVLLGTAPLAETRGLDFSQDAALDEAFGSDAFGLPSR